jgi:hypothetical protein
MWHERAAYGHFFYRIPNGESAADAYDRVSGFNESLWRQFAEEDFPSVLVLVTHGLMTRIFLMKWYHYSVEYFEDLRNVNHCEFVVMQRNDYGKYDLKTELRTWSGYAREQEEVRYRCPPLPRDPATASEKRPVWREHKFGGCVNGCKHGEGLVPSRRLEVVMAAGRDFGGSRSGAASEYGEEDDDDLDDATAAPVSSPVDLFEKLKQEQVIEKAVNQTLGDGSVP